MKLSKITIEVVVPAENAQKILDDAVTSIVNEDVIVKVVRAEFSDAKRPDVNKFRAEYPDWT